MALEESCLLSLCFFPICSDQHKQTPSLFCIYTVSCSEMLILVPSACRLPLSRDIVMTWRKACGGLLRKTKKTCGGLLRKLLQST